MARRGPAFEEDAWGAPDSEPEGERRARSGLEDRQLVSLDASTGQPTSSFCSRRRRRRCRRRHTPLPTPSREPWQGSALGAAAQDASNPAPSHGSSSSGGAAARRGPAVRCRRQRAPRARLAARHLPGGAGGAPGLPAGRPRVLGGRAAAPARPGQGVPAGGGPPAPPAVRHRAAAAGGRRANSPGPARLRRPHQRCSGPAGAAAHAAPAPGTPGSRGLATAAGVRRWGGLSCAAAAARTPTGVLSGPAARRWISAAAL